MSVPIYGKILGLVFFVCALFGGVNSYFINSELASKQYSNLKNESLMVGRILANQLARPLAVDDLFSARLIIRKVMDDVEEIEYVFVANTERENVIQIVDVEADLESISASTYAPGDERKIVWKHNRNSLGIESRTPILTGLYGVVRVGMSDSQIVETLEDLNGRFLTTLLLSIGVGFALAVLLTYFLVKPIYQLVAVTNILSAGDLSIRTSPFFRDEIGDLAVAFNKMAANIEQNSKLLQEKERMRALLLKELVISAEKERRYLARELHDDLGQSMSLLLMQFQSLQCDQGSTPCLHRTDLSELLSKLIGDVRNMAFLLRPAEIDDYGLDSALSRLAHVLTSRSELEVDYQYVGKDRKRRLPEEIEITIYRIAQEAISNIIRHAKTKNASILFIDSTKEISLVVEDDGVGFHPEEKSEGLGILGMKERAAIINAELVVESHPHEGTTIKVSVPLKGAEE